jgi:ferredoxin/flavodoxin---NADP+ reductase
LVWSAPGVDGFRIAPLDPSALAFIAVGETGDIVDVMILGAGPVGLSAAYYVGHRDGTVRIVESLEQIGGQVAATYPEKHVFDVAGFPKILGQKLVEMCADQGLQYGADVRLGEEAKTLEQLNQNGEEVLALTTDKGNTYLSRTLIVTAGHGAFEPRKLGIDGIDDWEGRGLHYVVREKAQFAGKHCVIVGGGDSALDWTLGLQDTAGKPITLVHRRDRFRALESSLNEARRLETEGAVRILTPHEVREVHGDGSIKAVSIENTSTGELERYDCEALITLLGFVSHLGAIAEWGIELEGKRQLKINPMTCETSMHGVYAAGDVAGYPGKITLITVGMGEAAIAANNAIAALRGEKVQPKYSTD